MSGIRDLENFQDENPRGEEVAVMGDRQQIEGERLVIGEGDGEEGQGIEEGGGERGQGVAAQAVADEAHGVDDISSILSVEERVSRESFETTRMENTSPFAVLKHIEDNLEEISELENKIKEISAENAGLQETLESGSSRVGKKALEDLAALLITYDAQKETFSRFLDRQTYNSPKYEFVKDDKILGILAEFVIQGHLDIWTDSNKTGKDGLLLHLSQIYWKVAKIPPPRLTAVERFKKRLSILKN